MTFSPFVQSAMQAQIEAVLTPPVVEKGKAEKLEPIYRLTWIDADYHDAPSGAHVTAHERTRDFLYLGAAIAWARRRIFHGHVFGDAIELVEVTRWKRGDQITESIAEPIDITLPGFVRWAEQTAYEMRGGYRTGKAERKCRWEK